MILSIRLGLGLTMIPDHPLAHDVILFMLYST